MKNIRNLFRSNYGSVFGLFLFFVFISSSFAVNYNKSNADNQKLKPIDYVTQKAQRVNQLKASGSLTNAWILENYADSVRENNSLGIQTGTIGVNLPGNISKLYFSSGIDPDDPESYHLLNVVDSLVINNITIPVDSISLQNVNIDSMLMYSLFANDIYSLERRIPGTIPGETFFIWKDGELLTRDLSTFYKIVSYTSRSVENIKESLEEVSCLDDVYYIGIPVPFTDDPPPEPTPCPVNEPLLDQQWYLKPNNCSVNEGGIDVVGAWSHVCSDIKQGHGETIAIIDNGFGQYYHPDLVQNVHPLSRVSSSNSYHGNAVAGVCGAAIDNMPDRASKVDPARSSGIGIAGADPHSQLLLLDYYDGTDWVADTRYILDSCPEVGIMSFSFGLFVPSPDFEQLLEYAYYAKGIFLTASAGNEDIYHRIPFEAIPGSLPFVVAVAASTSSCDRWFKSNYGYVDLSAPGVDIITTANSSPVDTSMKPVEQYKLYTGTSMSSPLVAGAGALCKTVYPNLTGATLRRILAERSEQIRGVQGVWNEFTGWGIINANSSVASLIGGLYCDDKPGDVNCDCYVNDGDITALIQFLFYGGEPPSVPNNADVNADCSINSADIIYLLNYLNGGQSPQPGCVEKSSGDLADIGEISEENTDEEMLSNKITISQNHPNPFNPNTKISFYLPEACDVTLEIYNILGQKVNTLIEEHLNSGDHSVTWDSRDNNGHSVTSGVYFYRLTINDIIDTKKMILLK